MDISASSFENYDLRRVICLLFPDSKYAEWAFRLPKNTHQLAPELCDKSEPISRSSRETTPIIGVAPESKPLPVLAITTDIERLFNPAKGHHLGSDSDECDVLLDDSYTRGVSAKHLRLFIDPEEGEQDNLTLQNLSKNAVQAISHEQRINERLTQGQQILLTGGTWTIYLHAAVDIVFKITFPDHGDEAAEYKRNWAAFREANLTASKKIPTLSTMNIGESAQETPLVKEAPYVVDWTELLGRGAGGDVRKASNRSTGDAFAAKVFRRRGDIHIELGFLQTLRHKHIVRYNAFIQDHGYDILIMEYLGGGTLHHKLRSGDMGLPIPKAKIYWDQLARAIKFLHYEKVMHRDIKPANILFSSSGDLKLCDFGISKLLPNSSDTTGTQLGTPHYAAPEIFQGQPYSFPTDIWSLGIVVLDMFRLSPPKLETWLIAGSDDSAWNRWLSAIRDVVQRLPPDLELLRRQLTEAPVSRPTAEVVVESLRLSFARVGTTNAVTEVRHMKRGALDQTVDQGRGEGKRKVIPNS